LSDTIEVKAYDKQNLMVPNLITPNNDNKNECFIIKDVNNFDILPGSSLEVYNRWGEAVFKASNYSNQQPWCGGSLTDGVYYYHIKTGCGEQVIKGWIEILSNEAKN
jgi:gliding motility-associated-like protein